MVFEGTEKKFELTLRADRAPLRARGHDFWHRVVAAARAQVLSTVHSPHCDAYLLSESSLFVWDHKVLMITCGTTTLPEAAEVVLDAVGPDAVDLFTYERKNEVFPRQQPTHFTDDARRLARRVPLAAHQLGAEDEHHLYVAHRPTPVAAEGPDLTVELLMHGLGERARAAFGPPEERRAVLEGAASPLAPLGVLPHLTGFALDEHLFAPCGYSMNALRGPGYVTMHVTPEDRFSYASFETDAWRGAALQDVLRAVVAGFAPRSFDLIVWERGDTLPEMDLVLPRHRYVRHALSNGYTLHFATHSAARPEAVAAAPLELT